MRSNFFFIVAAFCLLPVIATAQHHGSFKKFQFIQAEDTLPYSLLLPYRYDSFKKYPLLLFLHGSGERGDNNNSQLNHGGNLFTKDSIMENYPAIVVFPQCAVKSSWSDYTTHIDSASKLRIFEFPQNPPPKPDMALVMLLIKDLKQNFSIDTKRMYVGGLSMGGIGTYDIVNRMPKTFAAAFAICGAGNPATAKNMKKTSWWLFHGEKDSTVLPENSRIMASALKKAGAKVKLTIYPQDGHNSWDDAFIEPGLFKWMFAQKITKRKEIK